MSAEPPSLRTPRRYWPLALVAVVVIVVAAIAFATLRGSGTTKPDALSSSTGTSAAPAPPLAFLSSSPASGATGIDYAAPIKLDFSTPLAADTPLPTLLPAVPGSWTVAGATLTFQPNGSYAPSVKETVSVPATIRGKDGETLRAAFETSFSVKPGSIERLQQLLAELDYLPLSFAPTGDGAATTRAAAALDAEPTVASQVSLDPAAGTFQWRFGAIPSQLAANWTADEWNVVTEGAVIAFESDHNLTLDGEPGPLVWHALTTAVADRVASPRPYDYLIVTETLPETLYVWRDGAVAFQTPVNTGVSGAATPLGTWPVYLRFTSTTMTGTNPDGTKYSDPGVPWVSYFHGSDAVHGFWRSGYGYPQSDGCVEVPIDNAAIVYPYDPYGTLVTVTTGDLSSELGVGRPVALNPPSPPPTVPAATSTTTSSTTTTTAPARHHPTTTASTTPTTTTAPTTATTSTTTTTTSTTTLPPGTTSSSTSSTTSSVPPTT